jgi:hypothetical protein
MKTDISKIRLGAAVTVLSLMLVFGTAKATVIEGFESGSFNGSEAITGDTGIRSGAYFTINATEGTHQLLLTTINNTNDAPLTNQSGTNAVPNATLGSFFNVSSSLIRDGAAVSVEGSGFTINLGTLTAGSTLSFDYDFMTNETGTGHHNDFSYFTLSFNGGSPGGVNILSDSNSTNHATNASNTVFALETGYQTKTISIAATGTYVLGIGVSDATTTDNASGILVDNIQVVPEPTTIAFSIAGASLLVALRRRFKRS